MYGKENIIIFFNEKMQGYFNDCCLIAGSYYLLLHLSLLVICLGAFFAFLPGNANAATVYGHVYCSEGMECQQRITLLIYKGKKLINRVRTDNKGNYKVFLDPGEYKVKMNLKGESWESKIRSSSNPIRQDIHPNPKIKGR